jgi:hypothetical protein
MSFFYSIYGLNIKSSKKIAVLTEAKIEKVNLYVTWIATTDTIAHEKLAWAPILTRELELRKQITFYGAEGVGGQFLKICFRTDYGGLSFILNSQKSELYIQHTDKEPDADLDSFFVGTILGCVLRLKGELCLHASAININGKAVLLAGDKRSGKSTTAAAFAKMGYKVLSDDIAVVRINNGRFYVEPGYPKIRLRPKSLEELHPNAAEHFPDVFTTRDSRYADIKNSFQPYALPLGAIYLMSGSDDKVKIPSVKPVLGGGMIRLHKNTFASYIITPDMRKNEFEVIGKLISAIPLRTLHFERDVKLVNLQCEVVISDFETIVSKTIVQ